MLESYWNIVKEIVKEEQKSEARAEYGKFVITSISEKLTKEFGKSYSKQNLWYMRQYCITFLILHSLRGELSWAHYRLLVKIKNENIKSFHSIEAVENLFSYRRRIKRRVSKRKIEFIIGV